MDSRTSHYIHNTLRKIKNGIVSHIKDVISDSDSVVTAAKKIYGMVVKYSSVDLSKRDAIFLHVLKTEVLNMLKNRFKYVEQHYRYQNNVNALVFLSLSASDPKILFADWMTVYREYNGMPSNAMLVIANSRHRIRQISTFYANEHDYDCVIVVDHEKYEEEKEKICTLFGHDNIFNQKFLLEYYRNNSPDLKNTASSEFETPTSNQKFYRFKGESMSSFSMTKLPKDKKIIAFKTNHTVNHQVWRIIVRWFKRFFDDNVDTVVLPKSKYHIVDDNENVIWAHDYFKEKIGTKKSITLEITPSEYLIHNIYFFLSLIRGLTYREYIENKRISIILNAASKMYTESKYLRSDTEKIEEVYSAIFNTKINIKLKLDRKYVFVKNMVAEINFKEVITHQNALEILEYIYSGTYPVYSAEKFEKILKGREDVSFYIK
jgi:hypothetical protein